MTGSAVAVSVAGLVAGVGAVALAATGDGSPPPAFLVLVLAIAWGFIGSGLYARRRRPASRSGTLMVLVGFTWMLPALTTSPEPLLFTAGVTLNVLWTGVLAHLVLTFPSGRLRDRRNRSLVVGAYLAVTLLQVPPYLFTRGCADCPEHLLLLREDAATADWLFACHSTLVSENMGERQTDITVLPGDFVRITGGGSIWAGVLFSGENGPRGWDHPLASSPPYPHATYRYSLIGYLDGRWAIPLPGQSEGSGWFFVGDVRYLTYLGPPTRLKIGINDDVPGNGSGHFTANVMVQRGT